MLSLIISFDIFSSRCNTMQSVDYSTFMHAFMYCVHGNASVKLLLQLSSKWMRLEVHCEQLIIIRISPFWTDIFVCLAKQRYYICALQSRRYSIISLFYTVTVWLNFWDSQLGNFLLWTLCNLQFLQVQLCVLNWSNGGGCSITDANAGIKEKKNISWNYVTMHTFEVKVCNKIREHPPRDNSFAVGLRFDRAVLLLFST